MASVYNKYSKCGFLTHIFQPNCNFICHFGCIQPLKKTLAKTGVFLVAVQIKSQDVIFKGLMLGTCSYFGADSATHKDGVGVVC
jgi:hypothetical protein